MRCARPCLLRGMAGGVNGRASVRSRRGLCRALAVLAALIFLSVPVVADAKPLTDIQTGSLDTRIYTVSVENQGGLDVTSKYSAACWMCGINPNELDSEMRTELSNSGSGGRFFDFAQQFQQYYLNPTQAETLGLNAAFMAKILLWGDSWGFWRTGALDKTLYSGAMTDLAKVMRGESIGDGGTGQDGYEVGFTLPVHYVTGSSYVALKSGDSVISNRVKKSGDEYVAYYDGVLPSSINVVLHDLRFKDNNGDYLTISEANVSTGACYIETLNTTSSVQYALSFYGILGNGTVTPDLLNNIIYDEGASYYTALNFEIPWGTGYRWRFNDSGTWSNTRMFRALPTDDGTSDYYTYANGIVEVYLRNGLDLRPFNVGPSVDYSYSSTSGNKLLGTFGQVNMPDVPGNNWPDDGDDDPVSPGPDVPSPGDDPVSPPDVPGITQDPVPPPVTPVNQPEPTGTTPQDYTPWLRAILLQLHTMTELLNNIFFTVYRQFATHCNHIRQTISAYGQYLADVIKYELYTLKLYLEDLAEWLAEQLTFDVSGGGFDDSTVIRWLKEIFYKDSTLNFREASELPDSLAVNGALSWWDALIDGLIGDFGQDFSTGLETYVSLINGVIGKWPYSVPYDARNVFNLIVRVPVAPAFDVTLPAIVGWWDAVTFRVDLSPFSGAASACRSMFLVMWAIILIKQTGWLMGVLEHGVSFLDDFFRG